MKPSPPPPTSGWDAFASIQTGPGPTDELDAFGYRRLTLVDVAPGSDGGAKLLVVGWKVDGGWPVDATVGVVHLSSTGATTLRSLIRDWPPDRHDYVFTAGTWPPMRPSLVGRFLDRVLETDPQWHSRILGELASIRDQPGFRA